MERIQGRALDQLRTTRITPHFMSCADGSCLMETGGTRVICTASVQENIPPFLRGRNQGWLTAEYAMLPASTAERKQRDGVKKDGRGVEIGRLIGRALRQAVDLKRLGERSITIDCDVLEADGGTRTAAITGGFVALCLAIQKLMDKGLLKESPINHQIAAVSAGMVDGQPLLDLCYLEDSRAQSDVNIVMNEEGGIIEIQGTGEGRAFSTQELGLLLGYAQKGVESLMRSQREALGEAAALICAKQTLVLATNNAHKVSELKAMLGDRYHLITMNEAGFFDEIDEYGATFEENAIIKAEALCKASGYAALADDSGLEVDALGGEPGVHSARYAGTHGDDAANNRLLIEKMKNVPDEKRTAQFVSVLALASPFHKTRTFSGVCPGTILHEARGVDGFGYDPYFLYETGLTFAQMQAEEKNAVSHRSRAMKRLLEALCD